MKLSKKLEIFEMSKPGWRSSTLILITGVKKDNVEGGILNGMVKENWTMILKIIFEENITPIKNLKT